MAADRRFYSTSLKASASSGRVLLLLAMSGLAIVALVILSAVWAGSESDAAALDRQRQLVNNRLQDQVHRVSNELRVMSAGLSSLLAAFENRNRFKYPPAEFGYHEADEPGPASMFNKIATTLYAYDAAFIVTARGDMPYEANQEVARRFKWVRPLLQPMVDDLQVANRNIQRSSEPEVAAPSSNRVALMRLEGRAAVAGVIQIDEELLSNARAETHETAEPLYLIAFRFLDGATLDTLSREQGLSGARYARAADQEQNEVAFEIEATSSHEPIGFIIWKPDLPGSRVIGRLAPILSVAAFTILVLFLALVVRLRRSMRRLSESEAFARHLAHHDVLTGLPNRAMFNEQLTHHLKELGAHDTRMLVALIDLDKFKQVNDEHGHPAGDELLRKAVGRIHGIVHGHGMLARLGGDEFALLLPDLPANGDIDLSSCQKIVDALSEPFLLKQDTVGVLIGCSIGIAIAWRENSSDSEILRRADVALYEAKSQGRGRLLQYDPAMDLQVQQRDKLRGELEAVLAPARQSAGDAADPSEVGHLELFFQGIHRSDSVGQLTGAEALVRWRHPKRGLLTPDKFIPLAEDCGLIHRLGQWVLLEASKAAASWAPELSVSVNVSPSQLQRKDFAQEVASIVANSGLAAHRLELEVTEAALLNLNEDASANLERLRSMGVRIALDDFGTGFSSLSHLINFDVDRIKIDRSFVSLIGNRADGTAVVSAMVDLSRTLGKAITAEGVETVGQKDFLSAIGCIEQQGYLFSRPMPSSSFSRLASVAIAS